MQKKYKVQYEYINNTIEENQEKYVILDPSKEYSIISLERLRKEGIDINNPKLSFKPVYLTELERLKKDGIDETKLFHKQIYIENGIDQNELSFVAINTRRKRFLVKLELNILIGKENIEKKILVFVSEESNEESNEEFYLGKDFFSFNSFYLLKKMRDNTTKYILRQEIEIEDDTPDMKDDIPTIKEEELSENEGNITRFIRNNNFFLSLIVAIFAIIILFYTQYQFLSSSTGVSISSSKHFDFDEFIKYAKELGYEVDSLKLPSNEAIKRNIINCNNLAIRIDRSKAFNNTGPQLVINLNEFSDKLEIAKSSYTKMYSEGVWFFWNFEQNIKNILDYISNISNKSNLSSTDLLKSIQDLIEALNTFYSSVEKAYEATVTAESFRSGTHSQVLRAKEEVQKFINNGDNPSAWDKVWSSISSIIDNTKANDLKIDIKIAKSTESFLETIDSDLEGITKILYDFIENLDQYIIMLHKLQANVEFLETHEWNEYEIKRIYKLYNTIKENHKSFKSKIRK